MLLSSDDVRKSMFEDRSYKRLFFSAPQSVTWLVAAFLEPLVTVLTFIGATLILNPPVLRSDVMLCILVFALTFPGRNRFRGSAGSAALDILLSWLTLLVILVLCGYATNSIQFYSRRVLVTWVVLTPIFQWLGYLVGRTIIHRRAVAPEARRTAVVVGAGPLGVKVACMPRPPTRCWAA
jgi:putative colanic acid biosysnthesis UDP-glucose lipid carrier transferase